MARKRFSEERIISILKEVEAGAMVPDTCRKYGISETTYFHWRGKYGALPAGELHQLELLQNENRRLRSLIADQALDIRALKDLLTKSLGSA
jgi:putative transposase